MSLLQGVLLRNPTKDRLRSCAPLDVDGMLPSIHVGGQTENELGHDSGHYGHGVRADVGAQSAEQAALTLYPHNVLTLFPHAQPEVVALAQPRMLSCAHGEKPMPTNSFYKIAIAALAGFLLGAALFHSRTVKAQTAQNKVHVERCP